MDPNNITFERDAFLDDGLMYLTQELVETVLLLHIQNKYGFIVTLEDWWLEDNCRVLVLDKQRLRYNHFMGHACPVCDVANHFQVRFMLNAHLVIRTLLQCQVCNYTNVMTTVKYTSHFKEMFGFTGQPPETQEEYKIARAIKHEAEENEQNRIQLSLSMPLEVHRMAGIVEGH